MHQRGRPRACCHDHSCSCEAAKGPGLWCGGAAGRPLEGAGPGGRGGMMAVQASFPLPVSTAPMEAKLAEAIPIEKSVWQYEPKWDGFRCLAFKADAAVDIRAKSGKPLGRYFPELI